MRRLLRVFLPSWRFFDSISVVPVLSYRLRAAGAAPSDWRAAIPAHRRSLSELFWNPTGNWLLACRSLVEQLVDEANETPPERAADLRHTVTYRLVQQLVQRSAAAAAGEVQFKISSAAHDILVSEWHGLAP